MTPNADADRERIDTLLALTLMAARPARADTQGGGDADEQGALHALFASLRGAEREDAERRARWYAELSAEDRARWLARTLARARDRQAYLSGYMHPSHIIEALREEPASIRLLVLPHLPPVTAAEAALALGPAPPQAMGQPEGREPAPKVLRVVRNTFFARFVWSDDLSEPNALDRLSGVELARLVRMSGIREVAVACRSLTTREDVEAFLWRFPAEDAGAIRGHIQRLADVDLQRVTFAERQVARALSVESEPAAMLDQIGMRLLAICFAERDEVSLRFTSQKLPVEAARGLREMAAACRGETERAMIRSVGEEVMMLAETLHRARHGPQVE